MEMKKVDVKELAMVDGGLFGMPPLGAAGALIAVGRLVYEIGARGMQALADGWVGVHDPYHR